jgi:AcrR family transcriptional regulator
MSQPETTPTRGELTAKAIRQAIIRIEKNRTKVVKPGRKLSIKSVAEEAGVSRATIHNNHPALAERIREACNKSARAQRDDKNAALKDLRVKYTALRQELISSRELNQDMASEMATLEVENQRLRAIAENKNIVDFPAKRPKSNT